jgi:hypothetical protein
MSQNLHYFIGRMNEESLADALADFEDPLEGRAVDFMSSLDVEEEFDDYDYEDY